MNRRDIREEIKRYGFGDLDFPSSAINSIINVAYNDLIVEGGLPFTQTMPVDITVNPGLSGEASKVNLPIDFNKARSITSGKKKFRYLDEDTFIDVQRTNSTPQEAELYYYTIWADKLLIWPSPSASMIIKLWYHRTLKPLEEETDVPEIPTRYHYMLVYGALKRLFSATDEDDKHQQYTDLWNQQMEVMKQDLDTLEYDRDSVLGNVYSMGAIANLVRGAGFVNYTNDTIILMANQVLQELSMYYNWGWSEADPKEITINRGERNIKLPPDCAKPRRILLKTNSSNYELNNIKVDEYWEVFESGSGDTQSGEPENYTMWGTNQDGTVGAMVYPVPDRDYKAKVYYLKTPDDMTDINDTPPFPKRYHRIILLGVLIQCALIATDENLRSGLDVYKAEFEQLKTDMFSDDQIASYDKPFTIRGVEV